MSIFTKIKRMLTDDDSHDKHYANDSQYSDNASTNGHHHDDHHHEHSHSDHHHDDHEHSHDAKSRKHKDDKWDFFDQASLTPVPSFLA